MVNFADNKIEGSLFQFKEDPTQLFVDVMTSFRQFQSYNPEDKSVNGHNCRKSAILSQLFGIHKEIQRFGEDVKACEELIEELVTMYLTAYIELPSVITDLRMYFLYLSSSQKEKILESITAHATSTKKDHRLAKAQISIAKLSYIFLDKVPDTIQNLCEHLTPLISTSYEIQKMDEKPEKGERKMVDEQILLIVEIVQQWVAESGCSKK